MYLRVFRRAASVNPKDAFIRVANRFLDAARASLAAGLREVSGFCSYHAFESIGGAVCAVRNRVYSQRSHRKKLNQFLSASNAFQFSHAVARVNILLASVRNNCLYPEPLPNGTMRLPEHTITDADAQLLVNRVAGIIGTIVRQI